MNEQAQRRRGLGELGEIARVSVLVLAVTLAGHLGAAAEALSVGSVLALLPGLAALFAVVLVGYALAFLIPSRLPDLFWVSAVATVAGLPPVPGSSLFVGAISALSFTAMITPVLAFVALGLTQRDVTLFRRVGLQMMVLSVLVFVGTFVGSAAVAHVALRLTGG
ncbi:MAG: hypothetical protein AAGD86_02315 [Pseudomonadota bacterium]